MLLLPHFSIFWSEIFRAGIKDHFSVKHFFFYFFCWIFIPTLPKLVWKFYSNRYKKSTKQKFKNRKRYLTEKCSYIPALNILGQNIENWGRSSILSGPFLVKMLIWDNWIFVYFLRFFTYKTANFWDTDLKTSQTMHLICIYCIPKWLIIKHFLEIFTAK